MFILIDQRSFLHLCWEGDRFNLCIAVKNDIFIYDFYAIGQ